MPAAAVRRDLDIVRSVPRHWVLFVFFLAVPPLASGQCPECGPDAISEDEPNCGLDAAGGYDDFVNGGCYADEPRFISIEFGQTICGTTAMNTTTGVRDTDWYELVLTEETEIVWLISAEFRSLTGIVDTGGVPDCAAAHCFVTYAEADGCYPFWHNARLPTGTWWFFIAPMFQDEVACEFQYTSKVVVRGLSDVNGDGVVNTYDLQSLIHAWGPVYPWSNPAADLDGDATVGILDLLLLLEYWPT